MTLTSLRIICLTSEGESGARLSHTELSSLLIAKVGLELRGRKVKFSWLMATLSGDFMNVDNDMIAQLQTEIHVGNNGVRIDR